MNHDVGHRLRRLRERLGLSQRALARQAGVANATISQIESGKLNPTVSMLKKVLDGVPIRLTCRLGVAGDPSMEACLVESVAARLEQLRGVETVPLRWR